MTNWETMTEPRKFRLYKNNSRHFWDSCVDDVHTVKWHYALTCYGQQTVMSSIG